MYKQRQTIDDWTDILFDSVCSFSINEVQSSPFQYLDTYGFRMGYLPYACAWWYKD